LGGKGKREKEGHLGGLGEEKEKKTPKSYLEGRVPGEEGI